MTPDSASFGELLRAARLAAGLSQSDLSGRSGLPKPTLSRYENGHVLPSLSTLRKLALALEVGEASLLPGAETPEQVFIAALAAQGVVVRSTREAQELAERIGELLRGKTQLRA